MQSTTNPTALWQVAPLSGPSFGVRNGHRAVALGGIVYILGGWDGTTYFNDLWGLDLTSLVQGTTTSWVELLPNNASTDMIAARSSFSWDAIGGLSLVFGGSACQSLTLPKRSDLTPCTVLPPS